MMKSHKKKLKSEKEEAEFWDKHSVVDFFEDSEEVKAPQLSQAAKEKILQKRKNKVLLTIRLDQGLIDQTKQIAEKKAVGYQTLMRIWIAEGLNHAKHSQI